MDRQNGEEHVSVLLDEAVASLRPKTGGIYVDGTLGAGGHALRILEESGPEGIVVGLDWDEEALALARGTLAGFGSRVRIIRASYADLIEVLQQENIVHINGLLLDLGVSSLHLDRPWRGFSFRADGPLDMRMNRDLPETACSLIERLSEEDLADIFYHYGEERQARRIAAHVVRAREQAPIRTTGRLAEIVAMAVPKKFHPGKKHVATKVFQALRIAVNRELNNLVKVLNDAPAVLAAGARICIITFHSLEDRIVKQAFAANPAYAAVTGKPVVAGREELAKNPRARSAKLRVAEKTRSTEDGEAAGIKSRRFL